MTAWVKTVGYADIQSLPSKSIWFSVNFNKADICFWGTNRCNTPEINTRLAIILEFSRIRIQMKYPGLSSNSVHIKLLPWGEYKISWKKLKIWWWAGVCLLSFCNSICFYAKRKNGNYERLMLTNVGKQTCLCAWQHVLCNLLWGRARSGRLVFRNTHCEKHSRWWGHIEFTPSTFSTIKDMETYETCSFCCMSRLFILPF